MTKITPHTTDNYKRKASKPKNCVDKLYMVQEEVAFYIASFITIGFGVGGSCDPLASWHLL